MMMKIIFCDAVCMRVVLAMCKNRKSDRKLSFTT